MTDPHLPRPRAGLTAAAAATLVGCCAIWGVGLVMVKFSNAGISPFLNSGLRSVVAGTILLIWALSRGVPLFKRDGTLAAGVLAGIFFGVEFLALYEGLARTLVSRATIFLHCAPFVAAIGEHFFVPGYRLTRMKVVGLLAAFAGLGVALGDTLFTPGADAAALLYGDILCLIAGVCWGVTTIIMKASPLRVAPPEKSLLYQLAVSALILLPASYLAGESGITRLDATVVLSFAYTVLLVVVLGYSIWFWLMGRYSAASLHSFTFLTPIFGVIAGNIILGEPLKPAVLAGLALVALGIWLVNMPARWRSPAT